VTRGGAAAPASRRAAKGATAASAAPLRAAMPRGPRTSSLPRATAAGSWASCTMSARWMPTADRMPAYLQGGVGVESHGLGRMQVCCLALHLHRCMCGTGKKRASFQPLGGGRPAVVMNAASGVDVAQQPRRCARG
jgi:hypothetical protein